MREAILPRGRIVPNARPGRASGNNILLSARRISTASVLAIAGLAAVGVPVNALFFQDGAHPAPIFAGKAPPRPVEAPAPVEREAAEPVTPNDVPARAPAAAKRSDLAGDELAALSAEPALKAPRAAKPEAARRAATPVAAKATTAKSSASSSASSLARSSGGAAGKSQVKPAAKAAAPDAAKPVARPTDKPAAQPGAAKPVAAKPAAKSAAAAPPKPPAKPAVAKAAVQPDADRSTQSQRSSVGDLIGHLISAAAR